MASFHGKIGWGSLRKRENKNYRFIPFLAEGLAKIPQKEQKNQNIPLWLHFRQKFVGKGRGRVKIKIIVPFRSCPTRNRKLKKKSKKIQEIKKRCYDFFSNQNKLEKADKGRK